MAQLENRLKKLETQMIPPGVDDLVIFCVIIPAGKNGGMCPEYEKRSIQSGRCGDRAFTREMNETEKAFRTRVYNAVKIPGSVTVAVLA